MIVFSKLECYTLSAQTLVCAFRILRHRSVPLNRLSGQKDRCFSPAAGLPDPEAQKKAQLPRICDKLSTSKQRRDLSGKDVGKSHIRDEPSTVVKDRDCRDKKRLSETIHIFDEEGICPGLL
ncbi:MAG: hypothetical protein Q4D81_09755 [Eubacteriales bacterium]|nr:hypothetical protein [Eubacteriales bacterium]